MRRTPRSARVPLLTALLLLAACAEEPPPPPGPPSCPIPQPGITPRDGLVVRGAVHWGHPPDDEPLVDLAALPGRLAPTAQSDGPRGRATIVIGEWGPIAPRETRIAPPRIESGGEAVPPGRPQPKQPKQPK